MNLIETAEINICPQNNLVDLFVNGESQVVRCNPTLVNDEYLTKTRRPLNKYEFLFSLFDNLTQKTLKVDSLAK